MSDSAGLESLFGGLGASFILSVDELAHRLEHVRAFVFDWDGVFNRGEKGEGVASTFAEPDSMGTNLLRYAFWRRHHRLPVCAIVSGAHNASAKAFAQREHFDAVYSGLLHKAEAFESLERTHSLRRDEIAWVFDDANDFSVAQDCALRFLVRRDASPLLRDYAVTNGLADYVTAARSGEYPVREVAELMIGLFGAHRDVFESRRRYDAQYQEYFAARQSTQTSVVDAA